MDTKTEIIRFKTLEYKSLIKSLDIETINHTYEILHEENEKFQIKATPSQYEALRSEMKFTCISFGGDKECVMEITKGGRHLFLKIYNVEDKLEYRYVQVSVRGKRKTTGTGYGSSIFNNQKSSIMTTAKSGTSVKKSNTAKASTVKKSNNTTSKTPTEKRSNNTTSKTPTEKKSRMIQYKIGSRPGPGKLLYAGNDVMKKYVATTGLKCSYRFADFKCPECGLVEQGRMYAVKKGTKSSNSCGCTHKSKVIKLKSGEIVPKKTTTKKSPVKKEVKVVPMKTETKKVETKPVTKKTTPIAARKTSTASVK
eukprot:GHVU01213841.1.p1 GENE.GHVU01213841.1~~GHVU01213841.1.p1  ORF type:complete len:310 (+),score=35.02 GHVU01213841.1:1805-2734(+)